MKLKIHLLLSISLPFLCFSQHFYLEKLIDLKTSIRAIQIEKNAIWYVGSQSEIGRLNLKDLKLKTWKVPEDKMQFRSLAKTKKQMFFANTSSTGLIYRFDRASEKIDIVLQDKHPKAFYDAIYFKNNRKGIALGDPYDHCPTLQLTKNSGKTWQKIPCENLPKLDEAEAAFAASNSNIVWQQKNIWIATGGTKSRILHSKNNGENWELIETPFVQGDQASGMYSIDFCGPTFGIAVGGNYTQQDLNTNTIAITKNGGETWKIVANGKNTGYKTCVAIKPYSNGKIIVALGDQGISFSEDFGQTWREISTEKNLYIAKWYDQYTLILAGKDKILRLKWIPKKS